VEIFGLLADTILTVIGKTTFYAPLTRPFVTCMVY
jgi:hypothetical protein